MPNIRFLQSAVFIIITAIILTACSESETPPVEQTHQEPVVSDAGEAPVGRLDKSVVPAHYRIELRVDPRQESF